MSGNAIGIDLGTTFSCVAALHDGKIEVIPDTEGNRTIPSFVAFTNCTRLIGDSAKLHAAIDPANTVYDTKRLIGRCYKDPVVVNDRKVWPFKVINNKGRPLIAVEYKGKEETFYPEEISAMILRKMKETAERLLKKKIRKAVITVPAYFNNAQRQATQLAGQIAGLEVLRIINEPTAAAVAYGWNKNISVEKTVMIFDLGGGTFDVSILNIDRGIFEVVATTGDTHLGGEDFDDRMVEFFVKEIKEKYDTDISQNVKAMGRLKRECQKAKMTLSFSNKASMFIESLQEGINFQRTVQRSEFNKLCEDLFSKVFIHVEKALKDSKLKRNDIDEIVLVGGSTRIPEIQDRLKKYFEGKDLSKGINPDEAVALGAAVQAAIIVGDKAKILEDIILIDVVPLSLGVETAGGVMNVMIERNSSVPSRSEKFFTTHSDNATDITINVFEGERSMTKNNNLLGTFKLTGIPKAPRGVPKILVIFEINKNGILNVSAREETSQKERNITITSDEGRPSDVEIRRMIAEAERYRREDEQHKQRITAMNSLEGYAYSVLNTFNDYKVKDTVSGDKIELVILRCKEILQWMDFNRGAEQDEFEHHHEELRDLVKSVNDAVREQ